MSAVQQNNHTGIGIGSDANIREPRIQAGHERTGTNSVTHRVFAIGDIHGCCRTFRQMLSAQIGLCKKDTLYLLGDYIDRGPDSKGVIETLLELQAHGYDIHPLMGNHEAMLLQGLEPGGSLHEWLEYGGRATLKSYGIEHPCEMPAEHIRFFRSLPLYARTDTHILVHAVLNFCLEDPFSREGEQAMLWDRRQKPDRKKQMGRKLVVGHSIRHEDEIRKNLKADLIMLDNGCYRGNMYNGFGCLAAYDLNSGQLYLQEHCDGSQ